MPTPYCQAFTKSIKRYHKEAKEASDPPKTAKKLMFEKFIFTMFRVKNTSNLSST
jgi:hypothetical protein